MSSSRTLSIEQATLINGALRTLNNQHRTLAGALLSPLGLHVGQEAVLQALEQHGPLSQSQIAERIGCEAPSVTGMVKKLEANGLIQRQRSKQDNRNVIVALTDEGRSMIKQLEPVWLELGRLTVSNCSALEIDHLLTILPKLADHLTRVRSRSNAG
jgi:DNA-binding MarR family transcriptional regulator